MCLCQMHIQLLQDVCRVKAVLIADNAVTDEADVMVRRCVFGVYRFWCCAFIPFCVDDCKDAVHTCPSCNVVVGRHRRL